MTPGGTREQTIRQKAKEGNQFFPSLTINGRQLLSRYRCSFFSLSLLVNELLKGARLLFFSSFGCVSSEVFSTAFSCFAFVARFLLRPELCTPPRSRVARFPSGEPTIVNTRLFTTETIER